VTGVSRCGGAILGTVNSDARRGFWAPMFLPGDAEDRGGRGGEVQELEEVRCLGNCSPKMRSRTVMSR
jgi:hypothetical protein